MSELFHEYETTVIIRPDLDDADTEAIIEKLEGIIGTQGGHLLLRDDWGKKKLAYTIQNQGKGHYTLLNHLSPADLITELERNIRNEDRVIRFMTVLMDRAVDVPDRLERAAEVRAQRAAEQKAREEEEARRAAEAAVRAAEHAAQLERREAQAAAAAAADVSDEPEAE